MWGRFISIVGCGWLFCQWHSLQVTFLSLHDHCCFSMCWRVLFMWPPTDGNCENCVWFLPMQRQNVSHQAELQALDNNFPVILVIIQTIQSSLVSAFPAATSPSFLNRQLILRCRDPSSTHLSPWWSPCWYELVRDRFTFIFPTSENTR